MPINYESLAEMAESLRLYDAVDGGWEGDPKGQKPKTVKENLRHVGEHIAGILVFKDFFSDRQVESDIAPDLVQYGLRVVRWGGLPLERVARRVNPSVVDPEVVMTQARRRLTTTMHAPVMTVEVANAWLLGKQIHDEDHISTRKEAEAMRPERLPKIAGLLLQAAHMQAENLEFDLHDAFDNRIASLRERFDIPRLDQV